MKVTLLLVVIISLQFVHSDGGRVKRGFSWNPAKWKLNPSQWLKKFGKGFKYATIYPGTKWCGKGKLAKHNGDLGSLKKPDRCCRAHDLCVTKIEPEDTRFGIKNKSWITWSHCSCDKAFSKCLKAAKTKDSDVIGVTYFDLLRNKCIIQDYPIKCKKKWLGLKKKCKPDKSKAKIWHLRTVEKYLF